MDIHFETYDPLPLSIRFKGCNLSLASFYEMDISNTLFENCKLHEVDFAMANLAKCSFHQCDFKNAVFEDFNVEGADFTTAFNFTIDPTKNKIKKARYSKEGLIGLLK